MAKYLDATGLTQLWTAAKDKFYSRGGGLYLVKSGSKLI